MRREPRKPRRTTAIAVLPTKTPQDSLDLLAVIDPKGYRAICLVMRLGLERKWVEMTREQQRKAVEEVDRRRMAVRDRPGSRLITS